jgi:hypothetical protein
MVINPDLAFYRERCPVPRTPFRTILAYEDQRLVEQVSIHVIEKAGRTVVREWTSLAVTPCDRPSEVVKDLDDVAKGHMVVRRVPCTAVPIPLPAQVVVAVGGHPGLLHHVAQRGRRLLDWLALA